jgi:ribosomal protein S18 acetylase RimI-like enzyme
MYEKLGYVVYRRVKEYYQDENGKHEDGLGISLLTIYVLC